MQQDGTVALNRTTTGRLAWGIALLCFAMVAASVVLLILDRGVRGAAGTGDIQDLIPPVTVGALGALVVSRRPRNLVGWILLATAAVVAVSALADHIAIYGLLHGVSANGWPRWVAWAHGWVGSIGAGLLILLLLLFPDGKPLNRRWSWVVWITVVYWIGSTVATALDPTPVRLAPGLPSLGDPVGVPALAGFSTSPAPLGAVVILVLAVVGLLLRLRRSRGDERQQLKWFVYAVGVSVGMLVIAILLSYTPAQALSNVLFVGSFAVGFDILVPASAVLAILRYGLYEIDVVINKTIVYFSLAAIITAIYVGIVVGIGAVINAQGNVGLSILATAVVAVGFQPIRDRSRKFANRLVYGKRATPYEILGEFSDRVGGAIATEDILPRMAQTLAEGTGAARADVWLKVRDELLDETSWPAEADPFEPVRSAGDDVAGIAADLAVAVRHRGELLGAISIAKRPGEALTPTETKLATDLASQAGLVLRNVRLIEELRASRQRIVAAQDAAARRLERNIHDGAQQQLVALAIKLNVVQALARKDPDRADGMLTQLKAEAAEALENLRDLARGIYPPLLADQGLVAALRSQARKSPVPVSMEADGIGRFPQETEAAVYFCTLEALQNVAKYAGASAVLVTLDERLGSLNFTVRDDGAGFDPHAKGYGTGMQGMADRLAALGGELTVTSAPGEGTLIEGRVPVADNVPAIAT